MRTVAKFNTLSGAALPSRPLHLAIGMFDGVHLGHRAVIDTAVQSARRSGGSSAVLTFWPHPSAILSPETPTRMIMDLETKIEVLAELGVDAVVTQPFTIDYAKIEAEEFLGDLKRQVPQLTAVYVGENWRFGRGRRGDVAMLVSQARSYGVTVYSAPRVNLDGAPISSTRIREQIESGAIAEANAALGYSYFARGVVVPGKRIGRTIGFPTLNLKWSPALRPKYGVYAVRVSGERATRVFPGVANYGLRPTLEEAAEPRLEVHLVGDCPFSEGDRIRVDWLQFIRPEVKFADAAALQKQIARDRDAAIALFAETRPAND